MKVNTVLFTRDGLNIGNAIVIEVITPNSFLIKTDYGREIKMNSAEVNQYFQQGGISTTHKNAVK